MPPDDGPCMAEFSVFGAIKSHPWKNSNLVSLLLMTSVSLLANILRSVFVAGYGQGTVLTVIRLSSTKEANASI